MVKLIIDNQVEFRPEARYVFETIFDIMGLNARFIENCQGIKEKDAIIYYGKQPEKFSCKKIIIQDSDWHVWMNNLPNIKLIGGVPVISTDNIAVSELFSETECPDCFRMNFDLIAASFYLLTRREEVINRKRDAWGCFSEDLSISHKYQITDVPIVNIYAGIISQILERLTASNNEHLEFTPRWKDGKKFAVALTHDIDYGMKYSFANGFTMLARKIIKRKGILKNALRVLSASSMKRDYPDPYWSFDDFMKVERQFNAKSTFFVVTQSTNRRYDPVYKINRTLKSKLLNICNNGWEIGLHGSYESFEDPSMLKFQKNRLEEAVSRQVISIRQHYLRFSVENTFSAQEDSGFSFDSTLGYNEDIGFRAGVAAPFYPFDAKNKRKQKIMELPLAVMDGSLFEFRHYSVEAAFGQVKKLIDNVEKVGGLAVLLWHTQARDELDFPGWWKLYLETLGYLHSKGAWVSNISDIGKWWEQRKEEICRI